MKKVESFEQSPERKYNSLTCLISDWLSLDDYTVSIIKPTQAIRCIKSDYTNYSQISCLNLARD